MIKFVINSSEVRGVKAIELMASGTDNPENFKHAEVDNFKHT